ncbi:MAG: LysR family transcriptional regulator [Acetobacteraceae bacterium]|nr:LysR family transcriptional regulator [Acetobacteraceae bacterium]
MDRVGGMLAFVRAAEAGSLTGAAETLGLTASAVSKAILRLEERLGVQLLLRNSRRLSLTDDGALFLERCKRVLAEIEAAEDAIAEARGEMPRGRLRVSLPVAFGRLHVLPLLQEYLAQNPAVALDLTFEDEFTDLIGEGVDVAVRMTRNDPPDSRLLARRLATSFLVVCGSPAYLARAGVPGTPDDLRTHDCMGFVHSGRPYDYRLRTAGKLAGNLAVRGRLCANNGEALRDAALAGLGLAQLHSYIAGPEIEAGRLRPVLLGHVADSVAINLVHPRQRHASARVRSLVAFLVERVRDPAAWNAFMARGRSGH